ncbi:MAG: methyltransferase [Candidatus Margulisiibacteriota bacterium]
MEIQIVFVLLFALNLWLIWQFPAYRTVGSGLFLLLPLGTVFFPQPQFALDYFWWRIAGAALIVAGAGLMAWVKMAAGRTLLEIGQVPAGIATAGPYGYLRHPVYLGVIFIQVGWWWLWAAVYSFYFGMFIVGLIWLQGYLEEKLVMQKQFGDKFLDYQKTTGMFWVK